jgi:predicted O-methyltransferase YrrM
LKALRFLLKYLVYQWNAVGKKKIQSPLVFDFYTKVILGKSKNDDFQTIEGIREELKKSTKIISIEDHGAGSLLNKSTTRKVSDVAKNSLKSPKFAELLYRIAHRLMPENILELGTSLGISSMYLACANSKAQVTTVEGCSNTFEIAKSHIEASPFKNLSLVNANFDEYIPKYLTLNNSVDFVFIDGNHQKEPTLDYFQQCLAHSNNSTVFIFDDIYWSAGMEEAWNEIKKHPQVTTTIDLFFVGIVFLDKSHVKENFVLKF